MEEDIKDGVFICHGCWKQCELTIKDQNLYLEEQCALDNIEEWERKE